MKTGNPTLRRCLLPAAAALALALAPYAVSQDRAATDTVRLADGTTETGLIQSEEFNGLTIKGAGNKPPRLIPWKDVRDTSYRQADEYVEAQAALASGKMEEAEAAFGALAVQTKLRSVVRQQVLWNFALVLQAAGKADESAKALHDLIDEFPHGRYLGAAAEMLVGARLPKDIAGATAELGRIETATKDFAEFRPSVQILKATLLETQAKLPEALAAYDAASISPGASADVKAQADLGKARVLVLQKKPADAEALLRKLVAQDLPGRLLGAAWNGIGDLVLEQAFAAKDPDKLIEAAFAYLRTAVQYVPLTGETTREYERGLAGSARAFHFIAELEQNPERKQLYTQRYRARKELLARDYPGSEFLAGLNWP